MAKLERLPDGGLLINQRLRKSKLDEAPHSPAVLASNSRTRVTTGGLRPLAGAALRPPDWGPSGGQTTLERRAAP
eukprot:scaffold42304_cov62-Phaeocystis_antarctica.AAC.3